MTVTTDRPACSRRRRSRRRTARSSRCKSRRSSVRPGEVHALMGANGAGKSTLVKILTGAVRPERGRIAVRGRERVAHSPAEARRGGLVSVYQEPALIPDLDIRSNLRLTETPVEPFRHWVERAGPRGPRPVAPWRGGCRSRRSAIVDLARALAIEPDVLMLDEMTAALPANLTERVLEVVGRQRGGDRSVIFISHRMIEIAAVCDRATVLREGETVGVVDVTAGSEERIVELMLGETVEAMRGRRAPRPRRTGTGPPPRIVGPRPRVTGRRLEDARSSSTRARCSGVVALEGQGQDELFDILAGSEPPDRRRAAGRRAVRCSFRHPADAIRAGRRVRRRRPRRGAADAALGAREHRAAVHDAGLARWGPINLGEERSGRRRRSSGSRSTPAPRARCGACRAATSRR